MNFEGDLKRVQRALLREVFAKGIEKNEEQCKVWSAYKKGHEKVAEALQTFQKELYVNCMVPIGKRALMKGRLIHTNEVLASLGDGYFAKYSAAGATALCQRRIQRAEEMLKNLNTERDLFETRILASDSNLFDGFGGEIVEHWDEDQVADWKKKHREKEKEYHKKLAKVREEERKKIETEEDLFKRLDQLELEEELADELNRLEDEKYELLRKELREGDESEPSSGSEEDDFSDEEKDSKEEAESNIEEITKDSKEDNEVSSDKKESQELSMDTRKLKKSVSFIEMDTPKEAKEDSSRIENESSKDAEDTLRIEFTHSENVPAEGSEGDLIKTPADIYRLFSKPKSILKRSPNDLTPVQAAPPEYSSDDDDDEDETVKPSAYENVVKDIRERNATTVIANAVAQEKEEIKDTRPVSKFKRDRLLRQ